MYFRPGGCAANELTLSSRESVMLYVTAPASSHATTGCLSRACLHRMMHARGSMSRCTGRGTTGKSVFLWFHVLYCKRLYIVIRHLVALTTFLLSRFGRMLRRGDLQWSNLEVPMKISWSSGRGFDSRAGRKLLQFYSQVADKRGTIMPRN